MPPATCHAIDPPMTSSRLARFMKLCSPGPLRGDDVRDLAVDRDDLEEEFRPDLAIRRTLTRGVVENPKILLFGSRGCGKSTELARVEAELQRRYLIVGLDVGANRMVRAELLSAEELLMLTGLAIARAAQEVWGAPVEEDIAAIQSAIKPVLRSDLQGKINLVELVRALVLFGTTVVEPSGLATRTVTNLIEATRSSLAFEYDIGGVLTPTASRSPSLALSQAVNGLISKVEKIGGRKPLVLIDDLDKIDDAQHSFTLLTEHDLLSKVGCPMVVVGPSILLQEKMQVRLNASYDEIVRLYHVACRRREAPDQRDPEGFEKMRQIVRRRARRIGPEALLTPAAEDHLVEQSGGAVRELIRLLGYAADQADYKGSAIIELEHANYAVKKLRRNFESYLTTEDFQCLKLTRINMTLPNTDAVAARLLNDNRILVYSNGREWYYPHALLLPLLGGDDGPR